MQPHEFERWLREYRKVCDMDTPHDVPMHLIGETLVGLRTGGFRLHHLTFQDVCFRQSHLDSMSGREVILERVRIEDESIWQISHFDESVWMDCDVDETSVLLDVSFHQTLIQGGCWSNATLLSLSWRNQTQCKGLDAREATFRDNMWADTHLEDCDFRSALFSHLRYDNGEEEVSYWARSFVKGCDFRGAHFKDVYASGTTFTGCAFHGLEGQLQLFDKHGPVEFIDCDLSPNFDGSHIASHQETLAYLTDPDSR